MGIISQTPSNSKSNIAERVAFDPFLPQQDLINELIRNMVTSDNDIGQTYYLGQVVAIIEPRDSQIEVRDIFYSPSDNFERVTKDISDKKYNNDRKILLVHIPSFTTNGESSKTPSNLNYNNFTKIRVEYNERENGPVKPGNLIKIQFRDKNSFYDPYIIGIEPISSETINKNKFKIKEIFDKYLNCKTLAIKIPTDIGSIDFKSRTSPVGGYPLALSEIDNIFSDTFINGFKKAIKDKDLKDFTVTPNDVKLSGPVYAEFGKAKYNIIKMVSSDSSTETLIKFSYTAPSIESGKKYFDYVKQSFLKIGFLVSGPDNQGEVSVDIQSNLLFDSLEKKVDDYIKVSKGFNDSSTYYTRNAISSSSPQIISRELIADKCDSDLAMSSSIYEFVYNPSVKKKNGENHNKNDKSIITSFFNNPTLPLVNSYLTPSYFYQLAEIKSKNDLLTKNKDFYINSGETKSDYNKKLKNVLVVLDLDGNFKKISVFLKKMREIISKNEFGNINDQFRVLIIPRQVLKVKPKNMIIAPKQDKNSRHFYGKAVDIVIYLKLAQEIVQIPPEIVVLYAERAKEGETLGHGVFLNKNNQYNHIEFLDKLTPGINIDERFFTSGNNDELKVLEEMTPSTQDRINKLKNLIKDSTRYNTPNGLYPAVERLINVD